MFSIMCNLNVENVNLKFENKTLKKKLYDYRLQACNELTESDSDSSEDESIPSCSVVINKSKKKQNVKDKLAPIEKPSL